MNEVGKVNNSFTNRIITTHQMLQFYSLGGWVNKKNILVPIKLMFEKKVFHHKNGKPDGQHIELGIAENNLFLLLASLGISDKLFEKKNFQ